jgi:uncharacterized protein (DUF2164 family)
MPKIAIEREERDDAVARLRAYFDRERDEELGELGATLFLDFIAEEIGPYFYNKGLRDAQSYVARFTDSLDADLEAAKLLPPRPGESTSK